MSSIINDIKAKIDIVQLVSQYVKLKKAGRNFKGLSPFKPEKTPSFVVSPEKQIAYCFATNRGGDIFKFVQEMENLDFKEAVDFLADMAGLDPSQYQEKQISKEERVKRKEFKERVMDVCEFSAQFYEKNLWDGSNQSNKVLEYVRHRGLSDETIRAFRIGLAPDSFDATYQHLLSKKCAKDDAVASGQSIVKSTDSSKVFDRFRLRLMFPVNDAHGKVVAFGGRVLKKGDNPKYLNSPDSPVYNKSEVMYGWDKAKDAVRKLDQVIFVEGYFDVIAAHQAGITHVVATSGTALTVQQLKLVKRFTKNVFFNFDMDAAGQRATLRAIEMAVELGLKPSIIDLGEHKDADEACKAGVYMECVENAQYYLDYYLKGAENQKSAQEKMQFCEQYFEVLKLTNEGIETKYYLEQLSFAIHEDLDDVFNSFNKFVNSEVQYSHHSSEKEADNRLTFEPEEYLVGFILTFPEVVEKLEAESPENDLSDALKNVYKEICAHYNGEAFDADGFFHAVNAEMVEPLKVLSLYIEDLYGDRFKSDEIFKEAMGILSRLRTFKKRKQMKELKLQLKEAQHKGEGSEEALKAYSDLLYRNNS